MKQRTAWILGLLLVLGAGTFLVVQNQQSRSLPFPFSNLHSTWPGEPNYWRDDLRALGPAAVPPLLALIQRHGIGESAWLQNLRDRLPRKIQAYFPDLSAGRYRRLTAIWALGEIGPAAAEAVPELTRFRDRTSEADFHATTVIALAKIQPNNPVARSNVIALLTSSQQTDRFYVAQEFGALPLHRAEELRPFLAVLSDADGEVRANAAFSVGSFGPLAQEAAPQLQTLLNDSYRHVAVCAAYALVSVDPEQMPAALGVITNAILKRTDMAELGARPFFRVAGPAAWPALPWLEASLKSDAQRAGLLSPEAAALALAQITNAPSPAAIQQLGRVNDIGLEPVRALTRIGPLASNAVPRLRELEAMTISPTFRAALRDALAKITNPPPAAPP